MKIIMSIVLVLVLGIMLTKTANSEDWLEYDHKTYVGGYYMAVCHYCLGGNYNNDTEYWQCTDSTEKYNKGCAKGILDAVINRPAQYGKW